MTDPATRMRKLRERRSAGIRVLRIEVCIDTVEALIELNYLDVEKAHELNSVSAALAKFVEQTAAAVTSNGITLDSW